jgi:hypothetical protein
LGIEDTYWVWAPRASKTYSLAMLAFFHCRRLILLYHAFSVVHLHIFKIKQTQLVLQKNDALSMCLTYYL